MDLSFARFDRDHELVRLPDDLALLMVGVAARQAASPTAAAQARAVPLRPLTSVLDLLQPTDGAFSGSMATLIRGWDEA